MRQVAEDVTRQLPDGHAGQYDKGAVRPLVRAILARNVRHGVLRQPLVDTYRAGWAAGEVAAKDAIARRKPKPVTKAEIPSDGGESPPMVSITPNWADWTPGNAPAAEQAQNLHELIGNAVGNDSAWSTRAALRGNLLASIEDNRLGKLADAVSAAVADGSNVDSLTNVLTDVLDDPQWANMVATTEMARAMTAASMAIYLDAGIPAKSVATAQDDRVCVECQANEDAGVIPLYDVFPADDPPSHPGCRCAILPQWLNVTDYIDETGGPLTGQDILDAEASAEDLQVI